MMQETNNKKATSSESLEKTANPLVLKLQKLRSNKSTSKKIQEERTRKQNINNN